MTIASKLAQITPKIFLVFAILLFCIKTHLYGLDNFFPAIDLMVIYYWCIYRPSLLGNGFLFTLGFVKDMLTGAALGISSFTYLITRMLIVRKGGNFEPTFYFLWIGFTIVLMVSITIKWLLFSFVSGQFVAINMAIKQFIVSILVYPFIHNIFNKIYSLLPRNVVNA